MKVFPLYLISKLFLIDNENTLTFTINNTSFIDNSAYNWWMFLYFEY